MEILKTYCIDISSTTSKSRWPRNSSRMPMPKLTVSPFLGTKYSQISEISTFWRHIPIRKVAGFIYYILPNLNDRVSYQKNQEKVGGIGMIPKYLSLILHENGHFRAKNHDGPIMICYIKILRLGGRP